MQKVVLIVGASRGIGLATANYLAKQGYIVYGSSRKNTSSTSNNRKIKCVVIDVKDDFTINHALANIINTEGHLDIVINSAALGVYGPAEEVSIHQAQQLFDVNVFGIMRIMQAVLPQFRKQGHGLIINISSMAALSPVPGSDWYAASKYALEGLTESMAGYLSQKNIHLVLLEPGATNTQFITESSELGDRPLPDKPYGHMGQKVFNWHKEVLAKGQNPLEIAQLIESIIEHPSPNLRYQTSTAMKNLAKKRLVDPSGNQYLEEMKIFSREMASNHGFSGSL